MVWDTLLYPLDGPKNPADCLLKTRENTFSVSNQPGQYSMERMGILGQPKVQEAYNIINF